MYGLTVLMRGTLSPIRKVGTISNAEATITATAVSAVNSAGRPSQRRCQCTGGSAWRSSARRSFAATLSARIIGGTSTSICSYAAGRAFHVL